MPRKAKIETAKTKATAIPKTKAKEQSKTKTTAASKGKAKTQAQKETPKGLQIILEYHRNGNLGFSTVEETVNIPFLTQKKFAGKITTLFHFIRNTSVTNDLDSGKIATFQVDGRPVISITQKANDYEKQVFYVTKYKEDGSKQSTRKCSYNKARSLILQAYGFEVKANTDEDSEDAENEEMLDIDSNMELLPDTDFQGDVDNGLNDVD
ncbi:MAG: hypothetical protein HFG28_09490 [Eubacterium sp.]|nr:hypothetical protein [Eubacterium sp.]